MVRRFRIVDQISINIVLHDKAGGIEPIVNILISYPFTNSPFLLPPLLLFKDGLYRRRPRTSVDNTIRTSSRRSGSLARAFRRPSSSCNPFPAASRGLGPGCRSRVSRTRSDAGGTEAPGRRRSSGDRPLSYPGSASRKRLYRYHSRRG